ncbi:nucleotidyltransferase domain-containing protein [Cyanobium sp. ATX 6F1]|uniref:nucleotidyltransferase domain-containing protein n=1 Tax=Cyanobium sp. ATX 6F1 TaxID=2823702 RepID=UPI0020CC9EA3|nr:nucleotidyltransferase domain-containing protein [Cyanobium sp. ATX 6F1]
MRSLTQSVLRWPEPEEILRQVEGWAAEQAASIPSLQRVAVFGSYGRGSAGVGSDLDLLLIDAAASGPQHERLRGWPLEQLPLSCDALVLTPREHADLLAEGSRFALELQRDARWLWPPALASEAI